MQTINSATAHMQRTPVNPASLPKAKGAAPKSKSGKGRVLVANGKPVKAGKPVAATAKREAPSKGPGAKLVTFKRLPKADETLAPQAVKILEILAKQPGKRATVHDLVKACEGKITTVQTVGRLFTFYRAKMIADGFVTIG